MNKEVQNFVIEKTKALMDIPFCSGLIKSSGQEWLDALGTDKETEKTKAYIEVLEAEIMPIDAVISLAESEKGAEILGGTEKAKAIAEGSKALKAKGAVYCGCEACSTAQAILEKKDLML
jgi:hypothetical protein